MKRKVWFGLLSLILVCSMLIPVIYTTNASAAGTSSDTVRYTDWSYNDDFSKVTVDGKAYDNYTVLIRNTDRIALKNLWSDYLTNPYMQQEYTPDEFAGILDDEMSSLLSGVEYMYPSRELLTINGKAWQDTKFKDEYVHIFEKFFDSQFASTVTSKNELISILEDKSYNGLAQGIFEDKLSKEQAQQKYDLSEMKVYASDIMLYKNYSEFAAATGGKYVEEKDVVLPSTEVLKEKMEGISPIEPQTTVILHINKPVMTVSKGTDTKEVTLDAAPIAPRGTTLVPIRAISEAFGAKVDWFGDKKEVLIAKGTTTIKLTLGSDIAYVNGKAVTMLEAAQLLNGRTVIPLRFVSESMGYKVDWEGPTQKITITNRNK